MGQSIVVTDGTGCLNQFMACCVCALKLQVEPQLFGTCHNKLWIKAYIYLSARKNLVHSLTKSDHKAMILFQLVQCRGFEM